MSTTQPTQAQRPAHDPAEIPVSLLGTVGPAYFLVAFLARLPYAMVVVGVLTLVVSGRGSLALGGLTSAAVGLGVVLVGPLLGSAADRHGQRRVVLVAGLAHTLALVAITAAVPSAASDTALLAVALLVGATAPQVSPMSRSRLVGVVLRHLPVRRREQSVSRVMAFESAVDEIVFVFGPVLVGVVAAAVSPAAPVLLAALLTVVFVSAFALHPTARATVPGRADGADRAARAPAAELRRAQVLTLCAGVLGVGFFFGATLTSLTSFMADAGRAEQSGLLYGAMGVGSAALALGAMALPARFTLRARWLVFAAVLLAGAAAIATGDTVAAMAVALLLAGVGIGPTLATLFSLGAARSPRGRSATLMTLLGSLIIVGQSLASAGTARLAESAGTPAALTMPLAGAALVVLAGLADLVSGRSPRSTG